MSDHKCHAIKCKNLCKPEYLMCNTHWGLLPTTLKRSVLREYRKGQCQNNPTPSEQWHDAANAAIFWMLAAERKQQLTHANAELEKERRKNKVMDDAEGAFLIAVDIFSDEMKDKLLRKYEQGISGWNDPEWPIDDIKRQLIKHVDKGDFIDVANFAMFAWHKMMTQISADIDAAGEVES